MNLNTRILPIVLAVALGFCITWLLLNKDSLKAAGVASEAQHQVDTAEGRSIEATSESGRHPDHPRRGSPGID
jgi:hypothetical protein